MPGRAPARHAAANPRRLATVRRASGRQYHHLFETGGAPGACADDLARYPRTLAADSSLCDRLGVDVIFAPSVEEMYPSKPQCTVAVGPIADHLCGRYRPGHFQGVATIVLKLLQIVQPDRAYFGEKDAQQLAIVRRLVADFNVAAHIVGVPTVREADGLAVSSRNARLSPEERQSATALYRALQFADRQICDGATDAGSVTHAAASTIPDNPLLKLEYLEIVDPDDMQPVSTIAGPCVLPAHCGSGPPA